MEQNLPIISKKIWTMMRAMFLMLKKGISKSKYDLNMMLKRGKLASKSLHNLVFHHRHNWSIAAFHRHPHQLRFPSPPPSTDDEFSCTATPQNAPLYLDNNTDEKVIGSVMIKALEMLKSPMGKQLRVTDSPFPLSNGDEDGQIDEDAEKFIMRFYNGLKRQS